MNTNTTHRQHNNEYKYLDVLGVGNSFDGPIPVQKRDRHPGLEPLDIVTSDGKSMMVVTVIRSLADVPSLASVAEQPNEHANTIARDISLARFQKYGIKPSNFIRGREFTISDDHFSQGPDAATNKKVYVTVTRIPKGQEERFIRENRDKLGAIDTNNPYLERWKTSLEKNEPQLYKDIAPTLERSERGFHNPATGDVLKGSAVYGFGYVPGMSVPSNEPAKRITMCDMERDIGIKLAQLISTCGEFRDFHLGPMEDTLVQNPYGTQVKPPKVMNIYVEGNTTVLPQTERDLLWDSKSEKYNYIIPPRFPEEFHEFMNDQAAAAHGRLDQPIDGSGTPRTVIRCLEVPQMVETPWYPPRDASLLTRGDNICNILIARINARIENPHHQFKEVIPLTMQLDAVDIRDKQAIASGPEPRRAFFFERAIVANTAEDMRHESDCLDKLSQLQLDLDPNSFYPIQNERVARDMGNAEVMRLGIPGCLGSFEAFVHTQIHVSPGVQPLKKTLPRANYFLCERLASVFRDNPDLDIHNEMQILGEQTDVPATFFGPKDHPKFYARTHFRVFGVDRKIESGEKECPVRLETPSTPGSGMQYGVQRSVFVNGKEEADNYRFSIDRDPTTVRTIEYKGQKRQFWLWDIKRYMSIYADVLQAYHDQSNAGRIGFENNGIQARVNGIRPGRDNEGTGPMLFFLVCADEVNQESLIRAQGKMVLPRSRAYKRDFDAYAMYLRQYVGGKVERNSQNDDGFCFVTTRLVVDRDPEPKLILPSEERSQRLKLKSEYYAQQDAAHLGAAADKGDYTIVAARIGLPAGSSKATVIAKLNSSLATANTQMSQASPGTVQYVIARNEVERLTELQTNARLN